MNKTGNTDKCTFLSEVDNNKLFRSSFFHRKGHVNTFANIAYVYNFCKGPVYIYSQTCLKGLLHYFSTCIEITGNNWYCFIFKNVENCKDKFQRVKKL